MKSKNTIQIICTALQMQLVLSMKIGVNCRPKFTMKKIVFENFYNEFHLIATIGRELLNSTGQPKYWSCMSHDCYESCSKLKKKLIGHISKQVRE